MQRLVAVFKGDLVTVFILSDRKPPERVRMMIDTAGRGQVSLRKVGRIDRVRTSSPGTTDEEKNDRYG